MMMVMFTRTALRLECPNSFSGTRTRTVGVSLPWLAIHCVSVKEEPGFRSQAREFQFSSIFARESSKRVPIYDRGTGSKPAKLRAGSLQADLSLIV